MKTKSVNFLLESELEWENPALGVTRQIMGYDGQVMMVKVLFETGAVGTLHAHYHSQVTYVSSGKFEVEIEDKKQVVKAGDGFYVEPDGNHGVVCLEAGILVDVFSPMRDDFMKK